MKRAVSFRLAGGCLLALTLASGSLFAKISAGELVGLVRGSRWRAADTPRLDVTGSYRYQRLTGQSLLILWVG